VNPIAKIARRAQGLADLLPVHWRLPLRYRVQNLIGGLEPEFSLLPSIVPRDRIALDIGANMGVYSYALSSLAMHVHAFEPQAACCDVVSSWARRNGRRVTVHNAGVGSEAGELVLHVPVHNGKPVGTRATFLPSGDPGEEIRVPVITIDGLGLDRVGFVKIDVEGFEYDVLLGAVHTLRHDHPAMLIELDRNRHERATFERVIVLLSELGYDANVWQKGRLLPCHSRVWEMSEHHYNFVFLPRDQAVNADKQAP
jgi:FkbM family methyltransferase